MDRDDGRGSETEGDGVLEVAQRRPELPQAARQSDGHAQHLAPGGELDRLDPFRHQIGPAGHSGEAEVRRRQGAELAEEVGDVGLVTRAPAAEHVGVDHDERRSAHAAASS